MGDHPNTDLVRRGYKAFGEGDMATLSEIIAEDAVWHLGGNNQLSGDYTGRDNIFALFAQLGQLSEGTMSIELHDVLANDDHSVALATVTAGGSRGSLNVNTADTMHVQDGQLKEYWTFSSDEGAWDAYIGS